MGRARRIRWVGAFFASTFVAGPCWHASAVAGDRSVTIIEGVEETPPTLVPPPLDATPLLDLKTNNPAGLTLRISPNGNLHLGDKIALIVSTQHPGFLVLVDINAEGRWTQIYPNMMSLSRSSADVATTNLIKPGKPVSIPNAKNPLARFIFTADPPRGSGAVMAMLSDRSVQLIDLPEVPSAPLPLQDAVDTLAKAVTELQIASSAGAASFNRSTWSFAAAAYRID
jgi:hypothetical protein